MNKEFLKKLEKKAVNVKDIYLADDIKKKIQLIKDKKTILK